MTVIRLVNSDTAENDTWDYITRTRDAARHGRFQQGLLQKCSTWRLKSQNESYHERISSRDFNHKSHDKRVKDGTGNANSVKLCESCPWEPGAGLVSPACAAVDFFPRVPRDKRLLQAEVRKKKQAKYLLL